MLAAAAIALIWAKHPVGAVLPVPDHHRGGPAGPAPAPAPERVGGGLPSRVLLLPGRHRAQARGPARDPEQTLAGRRPRRGSDRRDGRARVDLRGLHRHPARGAAGWGIPMATDIAFAMAVLAIMGRGLPLALRAFLLTLAVVDDLGAITVIAIFYSDVFHPISFLAACLGVLLWWVLQRRRVRGTAAVVLVYVPLFLAVWYATHESGVHATVAGWPWDSPPGCRRTPARTCPRGDGPSTRCGRSSRASPCPCSRSPRPAYGARGRGRRPVPPLADTLTAPVTLGVLVGLLVGKPIGVIGGSWLVARYTRASLNPALRWSDMVAVGFLAGIGFTVSLLIAELAYEEDRAAHRCEDRDPVGLVRRGDGLGAGAPGASAPWPTSWRPRRPTPTPTASRTCTSTTPSARSPPRTRGSLAGTR